MGGAASRHGVALARHDTLLREAIEQGRWLHIFKTVGDAFAAAFPWQRTPGRSSRGPARPLHDGLERSRPSSGAHGPPCRGRRVARQRLLRPLSQSGGPPPLHRLRRADAISLATQQLVREDLTPGTQHKDLGEGGLKDQVRSEHVFQLVAPDLPADFPPLKQLDPRYIRTG